jgi:hypothetical protein
MAHPVLHRLPDHPVIFVIAAIAGGNAGIPGDEETSDRRRGVRLGDRELAHHRSRHDDRDDDHDDLLLHHVYARRFGKTVLKLSERDALLVTLLVAITNFIWNPVGGALSDRIGRKPVLLC